MIVEFTRGLFVSPLIIAMQACTHVPPGAERDIAGEISERSGFEIQRQATDDFWIPDNVSLHDGLSARESAVIALANNRAFQVDIADLGLARADLTGAGELPNPVFNVLLPVDGNLNEFSIAQMLSFLWQRPQRIRSARLNVEMIAERLIQDGLAVIMDTSIAHSEYIHAGEIARLESQQAEVLGQMADIVEAKFRLGETSQVEASLVRNDAMLSMDNAINARYTAESASFQLKNMMGFDDLRQEIEVVPGEVSCNVDMDEPGILELAFDSRPDLEAARININRAGEAAGLEKANIFNLIANLDLNEQDGGGYQFAPRLEIELPVFSQNQGGIARARGELVQAMSQFLEKKQEIRLQINEAVAEFKNACERVAYWQETIFPQLQVQASRIDKAYSAGETAFLSVLDNRQKLLVAEKSMADAVLIQKKAAAKLNFSAGQIVTGADP